MQTTNGHASGGNGFRSIGSIKLPSVRISPTEPNTSPTPLPKLSETAVALLNAASAAAAVDPGRRIVESLPPAVSQRLKEIRDDISTVEWGYETRFAGYTIRAGAEPDDLRAALVTVEASLRPCSGQVVQSELVRVKLKTAGRGLSEQELAMQLVIYAEDLIAYPEDAVVGVLRDWADNNKWWPTWFELKELLDERCERRAALKKALKVTLEAALDAAFWAVKNPAPPPAVPEPPRPPPTAEEKAARRRPHRDRTPPEDHVEALKRAAEGLKTFRLPEGDDPVVQEWVRQFGVTAIA
jgi:hypothetical protein